MPKTLSVYYYTLLYCPVRLSIAISPALSAPIGTKYRLENIKVE